VSKTAWLRFRFAVIFPLGLLWELCGRIWELWHFGPSQWILRAMRARERWLCAFIQWEKPR